MAYRGKLDDANAFLAAPWEMELPASVASTCYDVVLVDAPLGVPEKTASPGEGRPGLQAVGRHAPAAKLWHSDGAHSRWQCSGRVLVLAARSV